MITYICFNSYDLLTRNATFFHEFSFALVCLYPLLDTFHKQGKQRTASISFSSSINSTSKKRLEVACYIIGVPMQPCAEMLYCDCNVVDANIDLQSILAFHCVACLQTDVTTQCNEMQCLASYCEPAYTHLQFRTIFVQ